MWIPLLYSPTPRQAESTTFWWAPLCDSCQAHISSLVASWMVPWFGKSSSGLSSSTAYNPLPPTTSRRRYGLLLPEFHLVESFPGWNHFKHIFLKYLFSSWEFNYPHYTKPWKYRLHYCYTISGPLSFLFLFFCLDTVREKIKRSTV